MSAICSNSPAICSENWFITKFRKIFCRDEMNDDLSMVPARYNGAEDNSEYEEIAARLAAMSLESRQHEIR